MFESQLLAIYGFVTFLLLFTFFMSLRTRRTQLQMNYKLTHMTTELKKANQYLSQIAGRGDDAEEVFHETKLYVGNIDYSASEDELANCFSKFGQIEMVNIPVDRYTGKARGFGFVTFKAAKDAMSAMDLDGSEFKGRQIQVNFARERAAG